MMLILTLTIHFLLSLRSATSEVAAQQTTTTSSSYSFPQTAQDSSSRIPAITPSATNTAAASSLPPVLNNADATITTTTALRAEIQTWPVHSLFLPIDDPGNLAASIISVVRPFVGTRGDEANDSLKHPNHTAYALGCLPANLRPENASDCPLSHSLTLTEGVSTVIYTQIFSDEYEHPAFPSTFHPTPFAPENPSLTSPVHVVTSPP